MGIFTSTEFWAAIIGAVVGGVIAFVIQLYTLWEARKQRAEDRSLLQKGLANALLFKLARMHSNIYNIHQHFWESLEEGRKASKGKAEPWQVVRPLANLSPLIHLTPEEMGMLLSQKNDEVFNAVMDMEPIHTALIGAVQYFNTERIELGDRLAAVSEPGPVVGDLVHGRASDEAYNALRPKMMGVNSLAVQILASAKNNFVYSGKVMRDTHALFRVKLNLDYKMVAMKDADDIGAPPADKTSGA